MKNTAVNFLLLSSGAIMTYEFWTIITQGRIYPIPNITVFAVYGILILGAMIFAICVGLGAISFRETFTYGILFAMGAALLLTHTIMPIIFLTRGGTINSYYGYEPRNLIALTELSLAAAIGLYGLYGLLLKYFRRTKTAG